MAADRLDALLALMARNDGLSSPLGPTGPASRCGRARPVLEHELARARRSPPMTMPPSSRRRSARCPY
eukprot:6347721-Pyramimonas_sp.AAC.1